MILMNSCASDTDEAYLEDIIQKINDVFGVGLTEEDRIIIDKYEEMLKSNKEIVAIAKANSYEDFVSTFGKSYFKRVILREVLLRLRIEMIDWLRKY